MISEERLRQAAQKAGEALADSLPEPEDCRRQFSPAFERRMKKLLRRSRHPVLYQSMKRAACFLLVCLIGSGAFLTVNAEARGIVFGWVSEQVEGAQHYFFDGPPAEGTTKTEYTLSKIPEGYWLEEVIDHETWVENLYVNENGLYMGFGYLTRETSTATADIFFLTDGMEKKQGSVHRKPAELYLDNAGETANGIVWRCDDSNVLAYISGYFNAEELTRMAEQVILKK